jgi:hypothetical protein
MWLSIRVARFIHAACSDRAVWNNYKSTSLVSWEIRKNVGSSSQSLSVFFELRANSKRYESGSSIILYRFQRTEIKLRSCCFLYENVRWVSNGAQRKAVKNFDDFEERYKTQV